MLALVATGRDAEVDLREVDDPVPRPGEVLVAVRAVSLNRGEVRALGTADDGWRPGWDLAGEVVTPATNGNGPAAGTRVVGLVRSGAWAQLAAVRTDRLTPLPAPVGFGPASTLPVAGLTAWRALQVPGAISDRRVLVTGAAGGVGRFAVQLASHLGARVTAVVGSERRGAGLGDLGAEEVVIGMPDDGEFDVILECIGGRSLSQAMELVAPRGCIVSYGTSSDEPASFDAGSFFRKGGPRLHGLLVFEEIAHHRCASIDLAYLAETMCHGGLDPQIGLETSWRDAATALRALMARQVPGKAVLHID
jgi:NADPH:quinone reductase-like Zn-dependent oxidoreductase